MDASSDRHAEKTLGPQDSRFGVWGLNHKMNTLRLTMLMRSL